MGIDVSAIGNAFKENPNLGGALLGGAGGALGAMGTGMRDVSNMRYDAKRAQARNDVLARERGIQKGYQAENYGNFDKTLEGYGAAPQADALANATASRDTKLQGAIDTAKGLDAPTTGGPAVVQSEFAKRLGAALADSKSRAASAAGLAGYGDQWVDNGLRNVDLGRKIDTTNNFAQGRAALLPALQDFAEYSVKAPSGLASTFMTGLGSLMSSYGGSMYRSPSAKATDPTIVRQPGYNARMGFASPTQRA